MEEKSDVDKIQHELLDLFDTCSDVFNIDLTNIMAEYVGRFYTPLDSIIDGFCSLYKADVDTKTSLRRAIQKVDSLNDVFSLIDLEIIPIVQTFASKKTIYG